MASNWRKIYAMKKQAETKLLKIIPNLTNDSGIYTLTRFDENGFKFCYIGQAKHLIDRLVSHLNGYSQRIDISLKKRGFYDKEKRQNGWRLSVEYFDESELDEKETTQIKLFASMGFQLYNRTSGSQGQGKVGLNDGQSTKGYRDGLHKGYQNCVAYIKELFDRYLDYETKKEPQCYKKNGEIKEIYKAKKQEFGELLEGKNNETKID